MISFFFVLFFFGCVCVCVLEYINYSNRLSSNNRERNAKENNIFIHIRSLNNYSNISVHGELNEDNDEEGKNV